jgi:hypothetical protein
MKKRMTTAELNRIIERWDSGAGVTAAVQAFAQTVPVAERTVWYVKAEGAFTRRWPSESAHWSRPTTQRSDH